MRHTQRFMTGWFSLSLVVFGDLPAKNRTGIGAIDLARARGAGYNGSLA